MKRLRKNPHFLLVIALALPLGLSFLYYDLLADKDLIRYRQISMTEKTDLLSFQREELRISVSEVHSTQTLIIVPCVNPFSSSDIIPALPSQSYSILRC
jgi:hypothetical protein